MITSHEYSVNLVPSYGYSERIHASQFDTGRQIVVTVYNGSALFDLTGHAVTLEGKRADGFLWEPITGTVNGSKVTFNLTGAVTKVAGKGFAELVVKKNSERVGSANIDLIVEKAADGIIDDVVDEHELIGVKATLTQHTAKIVELDNRVEALEEGGGGGGTGSVVNWSQIFSSLNGEKIAEITINGVKKDVYAPVGKTNKVQIDFDGTSFKINGSTLNYKQLYDAHLTSPDFAFVVYGDRAYLLSYVQSGEGQKELRFQSSIAVTATGGLQYSKVSGIYAQSVDGNTFSNISVADITNENTAYKATVIDTAHNNDNWYPSVKAVKTYADSLGKPSDEQIQTAINNKIADGSLAVTSNADARFERHFVFDTSAAYSILNTSAKWIDYPRVNGSYVGSDGAIVENSNAVRSDYYPVQGGSNIRYGTDVFIAVYNSNKEFIEYFDKPSADKTVITLSDEASFIIVNCTRGGVWNQWLFNNNSFGSVKIEANHKWIDEYYTLNNVRISPDDVVGIAELEQYVNDAKPTIEYADSLGKTFELSDILLQANKVYPFKEGYYTRNPFAVNVSLPTKPITFYDSEMNVIYPVEGSPIPSRTDLGQSFSTTSPRNIYYITSSGDVYYWEVTSGHPTEFPKIISTTKHTTLTSPPKFVKGGVEYLYNYLSYDAVTNADKTLVSINEENAVGLIDQIRDSSNAKNIDLIEEADSTGNDEYGRRMRSDIIRLQNEMRHAIRIGTYNVRGSGGYNQNNWGVLKKCFENFGIDICGLQEVSYPMKNSGGYGTFEEHFTGWLFGYASDNNEYRKGDATNEGKNQRMLLSRYPIDNTVETSLDDGNPGSGDYRYVAKSEVNLPRYRDKRGSENLKMSIYNTQLEVMSATKAQDQARRILAMAQADKNPFIIIMGDTNDFTITKEVWKIFEEGGFTPVADTNTSTVSGTYDYNCIDNFFVSSRISAIDWDVIWSQRYPWTGTGYSADFGLSDHDLVIADVILDYSDIRCINTKNCTVTLSNGKNYITADETVTITVTPDEGKSLSSVYDCMITPENGATAFTINSNQITVDGSKLIGDVLITCN